MIHLKSSAVFGIVTPIQFPSFPVASRSEVVMRFIMVKSPLVLTKPASLMPPFRGFLE